jgi:hypothetical protein
MKRFEQWFHLTIPRPTACKTRAETQRLERLSGAKRDARLSLSSARFRHET